MSFNLRWDGFDDGDNAWSRRRDLVVEVLRTFQPDAVGTQEPMIRQVEDLTRALPALDVVRFDNDPVYVRTQQILFRHERFERMEEGGFLLADGTNEHGTVRYCTWVRLRDRTTRRTFEHYNLHLDHRSAASRQQGVVRLVQHLVGRAEPLPFAVTGDFNAAEDSPAMAFLRGEQALTAGDGVPYANPLPLVDTYRVLHPDAPASGTASGWGGVRTGRKIDHVLVTAGAATVLEAAIVHTSRDGRHPSDHFPVTAVVEWP
jgi:endonuclease/exonuclease/phosphatase family metal-dependent hydrolase